MKFLGRVFRYVAWFIVTAGIAWVMKKAFEGAARERAKSAPGSGPAATEPRAKTLFRDPICGTYVAEDISYFFEQGAQTLHFCSRDCLEHYRRDHHLDYRAANGITAGA